MKNLIKQALNIISQNFILISVIIFIFLLIQILPAIILAKNYAPTGVLVWIYLTMLLLYLALVSGWLNMVKNAVKNYKAQNTKSDGTDTPLYANFFSGIGEKFFINLKISLLYCCCLFLIFLIIYKIITMIYPQYYLSLKDCYDSIYTLMNITGTSYIKLPTKVRIFANWSFLFSVLNFILTYLSSFLFAVTYFSDENHFVTVLKEAIIFIAKRFFKVFAIFIIITFAYLLLIIFGTLSTLNSIFSFLFIIAGAYYITLYAVMVFSFYDRKTQGNSYNGSNSNR